MGENTGTWDAKLTFALYYPSSFLSSGGSEVAKIIPIESFSTTETINQITIDSVSEAHIGFATAMGEFTGTFKVYETSEVLAMLDELIVKNLYFDIVMAGIDEGDGSDWKVERTLLIGCKITRRDRSYVYGRIPSRTYGFKYLRVADKEKKGENVFELPFGDGVFSMSIGEPTTPSTDTRETTELQTGK